MGYGKGMSDTTPAESFVPLHRGAVQLGVPAAWLKGEALADRVPCLRAGRRILVNIDAVKAALLERARQGTTGAKTPPESEVADDDRKAVPA